MRSIAQVEEQTAKLRQRIATAEDKLARQRHRLSNAERKLARQRQRLANAEHRLAWLRQCAAEDAEDAKLLEEHIVVRRPGRRYHKPAPAPWE
jgi:hypothetical protein